MPDVKKEDFEVLLVPILADAAQRAGVPVGDVRVESLESAEWPDTSLGCPQPGVMYAQVVTPGYRIEVVAGDEVFDYRADTDGRFEFCS